MSGDLRELAREARYNGSNELAAALEAAADVVDAAQPMMDELERMVERGEISGEILVYAQAFEKALARYDGEQ